MNKLIDRANQLWDERNKRAVEEGEEELPRMLPLVRLKVCFILLSFLFPLRVPFFFCAFLCLSGVGA